MKRSEILWTFLLWFALLWWQGGFMFYSSIVVYIATNVLGSAFEQGKITARVMLWLNGLGTLTILLMLADLLRWKGWQFKPRGMWICWLILAITQALLWNLREEMVAVIDLKEDSIRDRASFREMHEWYMRWTSVQWGTCLAYMIWLIARGNPPEPSQPGAS
ncbi:hypothetical protein KIH39_04990 [Telmatocola sphagniphila]|uniref:DUF4149 domain-containing protein n=1 Tax=Telmatocola sphagniphila TaxID=1123043 RepID=A0A8E6BA94_9BACT|nr:hypothetical protein [Telmatocola sphagniphila]QVL33275.1 hypothetical protein KIH39_04990 [Telmatocola sphagniphila]